jgi:hypothetical protein
MALPCDDAIPRQADAVIESWISSRSTYACGIYSLALIPRLELLEDAVINADMMTGYPIDVAAKLGEIAGIIGSLRCRRFDPCRGRHLSKTDPIY